MRGKRAPGYCAEERYVEREPETVTPRLRSFRDAWINDTGRRVWVPYIQVEDRYPADHADYPAKIVCFPVCQMILPGDVLRLGPTIERGVDA